MIIAADRIPVGDRVRYRGEVDAFLVEPPARLSGWGSVRDSDPFGRPDGCGCLPDGHCCALLIQNDPGAQQIAPVLRAACKPGGWKTLYLVGTEDGQLPSVRRGFRIQPAPLILQPKIVMHVFHGQVTIKPRRCDNGRLHQRWHIEVRAWAPW
jgi:hypothetical protein